MSRDITKLLNYSNYWATVSDHLFRWSGSRGWSAICTQHEHIHPHTPHMQSCANLSDDLSFLLLVTFSTRNQMRLRDSWQWMEVTVSSLLHLNSVRMCALVGSLSCIVNTTYQCLCVCMRVCVSLCVCVAVCVYLCVYVNLFLFQMMKMRRKERRMRGWGRK